MQIKKALFLKTKNIGDSIILTSSISALPENYIVDVVCYADIINIIDIADIIDIVDIVDIV